ncbi:MAG: peptidoglycan-associated lipoprotein Pal [Pseudomonadota bacterium]
MRQISVRKGVVAALAVVVLAVAGCSSKQEAPANASTVGANASSAGGSGSLNPASVEYFRVSVGDRVFFETDQSTLTGAGRATLDNQARWLQLNPQTSIVIEGHADERGTREYNLALGARRSNAVKTYLESKGVSPQRMRTISYGKERPVKPCSQPGCWDENRRAVTIVQGAPLS